MALLPPLATVDDLAARITVADESRAEVAIGAASTLIWAEVDPTSVWLDTDGNLTDAVPDIVRTICLDLAQDRYENPGGLRSETIGGYSYTNSGDVSGGRQLTMLQRSQIRRAAGMSAVGTITLESPVGPLAADIYIAVDPPGEPIPWAGPDGW